MAVNNSRSMNQDFLQGSVDSSYISITPDRGGVVASVPSERLSWPNFAQAEQNRVPKFVTDATPHLGKDVEVIR